MNEKDSVLDTISSMKRNLVSGEPIEAIVIDKVDGLIERLNKIHDDLDDVFIDARGILTNEERITLTRIMMYIENLTIYLEKKQKISKEKR